MFDPILIFNIIVFGPLFIFIPAIIIIIIANNFPFSERKQSRHDLTWGETTAGICVFIVGLIIGIYTSETLMWLFFLVVIGICKLYDIYYLQYIGKKNGILISESKIDKKPLVRKGDKALLKSIRRKKNKGREKEKKKRLKKIESDFKKLGFKI